MKKVFKSLFFLCFIYSTNIYSQSSLQIQGGLANDEFGGFRKSFFFSTDYTKSFKKKSKNGIGFSLGLWYRSFQGFDFTVNSTPFGVLGRDIKSGLPNTQFSNEFYNTGRQLATHTFQSTCLNFDAFYKRTLINHTKFQANIKIGSSLAYYDVKKIIESILVEKSLNLPNGKEIIAVIPLYSRFLDIGITIKADLFYKLNEENAIGVYVNNTSYFISKSNNIGLGLSYKKGF